MKEKVIPLIISVILIISGMFLLVSTAFHPDTNLIPSRASISEAAKSSYIKYQKELVYERSLNPRIYSARVGECFRPGFKKGPYSGFTYYDNTNRLLIGIKYAGINNDSFCLSHFPPNSSRLSGSFYFPVAIEEHMIFGLGFRVINITYKEIKIKIIDP